MKRSRLIGWNPERMKKQMLAYAVEEQTNRFINYATEEIKKLGDMIQTYSSRNHMDRTGNLLNSLCWGVYYKGKKKSSGFYRKPVLHQKGIDGTSASYLHEFFKDKEEVNGRRRAENFLTSYKPESDGWQVIFAILAPYWGYWESGFTMKINGGERGTRFMQFQVMTHFFDDVRASLRPAETRLTVYVPEYSLKSRKYKKKKSIPNVGRI